MAHTDDTLFSGMAHTDGTLFSSMAHKDGTLFSGAAHSPTPGLIPVVPTGHVIKDHTWLERSIPCTACRSGAALVRLRGLTAASYHPQNSTIYLNRVQICRASHTLTGLTFIILDW